MPETRRTALSRLTLAAVGLPIAGALTAGPTLDATAAKAMPSAPATSGRVSIGDFGAKADNSTDAAPAIRAAIAAVRTREGAAGTVWFPPGFFVANSPIAVPKNIVLAGESPIASRLRYAGPSTGAFLTFGQAGRIATFTGLRGLWIDATGRADVAVLLHGPQEGSMLSEAIVAGARNAAVEVRSAGITGGSNKFVIERCWLWTTGDDGMAGVRLGAGSGPLSIRDTTMSGNDRTRPAPDRSAGLVATQSIVTMDNVNAEYFQSHSYLDRSQAEIRGATGFFNKYGVRTTTASTSSSLDVINADFDRAEQCIVDRGAGVTIRYCRSYSNESYRHDRRHFRGNHWELGSAKVYQSSEAQATMGFTSPATGDTRSFKFSMLLPKGWRQSAAIDDEGRFGTADSSWDGAHLRMGAHHLWVDGGGRLRIKKGEPKSEDDGRAIG